MRANVETRPQVDALFAQAAGGDRPALEFLWAIDGYLDEIAAFVHGHVNDYREFIRLLAKTNGIYSMDFYVAHAAVLQLPVLRALDGLLEASERAQSEDWQARWAEYAGLGMAEIVLCVATVVIGWEKASALRPMVRELAWASRVTQPQVVACS